MNIKFNVLLFCSCTVLKFCLYFLYLLHCISKWRVAIKELSLADSKRCSVSKVTTHLHCSHGHHIYHLVHGIHWLANQRRITQSDVRRAGQRLSHTQQKHDCRCRTWQEPQATLTDTTIDGVSVAWLVDAWHEVCIKQTCSEMCYFKQRCTTHSWSLLHLWIKLRPSSCLKWHLSNNWVVEIWVEQERVWHSKEGDVVHEYVYVMHVLTSLSKVIG